MRRRSRAPSPSAWAVAHFLFTVDIVGWGGDGHSLQLPEPGAGGMWLS